MASVQLHRAGQTARFTWLTQNDIQQQLLVKNKNTDLHQSNGRLFCGRGYYEDRTVQYVFLDSTVTDMIDASYRNR